TAIPMHDLCTTFRKEAGAVWNRMHKAATVCMSLSEETITELALYNVAFSHRQTSDIVITVATKPAERRHGADWQWWLVRGNQGIGFRVQAKRLFPDGRYRSLRKLGSAPYEQLDRLVKTSRAEQLVPLYCFYNFHHNNFASISHNACRHEYR